MLHLDNTEVAFKSKNDRDLAIAHALFSAMKSPLLSRLGKGLMKGVLKSSLPFDRLFKATIFRQFCGGETLGECMKTVENLYKHGVLSYITYAAEGKEDQQEFEKSTSQLLRVIEATAARQEISFAVFKATSMASYEMLEKVSRAGGLSASEETEWGNILGRVDRVCAAAAKAGLPINIDAEESWIQPALDKIVEKMMGQYNRQKTIVFNTFQMYRKDRLDFLRTSYEKAVRNGYYFGAKLVRGAYMEKERERALALGYPSPIHDTKQDSDRAYDEAVAFCVDKIENCLLVVGTHNTDSVCKLAEKMEAAGLRHDDPRIFTAQLLGMSDNITFNMAHEGYRAVKYVPFGPLREVIPYLLRRAEENSSIQGQTTRELALIRKERERRRKLAL